MWPLSVRDCREGTLTTVSLKRVGLSKITALLFTRNAAIAWEFLVTGVRFKFLAVLWHNWRNSWHCAAGMPALRPKMWCCSMDWRWVSKTKSKSQRSSFFVQRNMWVHSNVQCVGQHSLGAKCFRNHSTNVWSGCIARATQESAVTLVLNYFWLQIYFCGINITVSLETKKRHFKSQALEVPLICGHLPVPANHVCFCDMSL